MTDFPSIDLAALAERRDEASRDVFVSLFADLTDRRHRDRIEERAKEIRAALEDDASRDAFERGLEAALNGLGDARGRGEAEGAAVFASPEHDFVEAHALAAPIPTALVLDSSPYVRPLARFVDEYESFVLVLLDGERAAVHLVDEARAERVGSDKVDLIGRHKKGGMSQARYQRHRQGVVEKLYDEVAERVADLLRDGEAERVIVAGPGQAKREFVGGLPKEVADAVIAVEDVDFSDAGDGDLVDRFVAVAKRREEEDSLAALAVLKSDLKRGELAISGPFPVARAARDGRVDCLVVRKGAKAGGAKCEEHDSFFEVGEACECGNRGTRVDLIEEAIEYAARSESGIEFVDPEDAFLDRVGGVGATLRW